MAADALARSLRAGPHALLARMAGRWTGVARTWFQPGTLADTSPIEGEVRLVLGGRFAVHEYRGTLMGEAMEGIAVHGFDLHRKRFTMAWIDSCHNGTATMRSEGAVPARRGRFSVTGSYPDGAGGPDWGWRTQVDVSRPRRLVITHFNLPPLGGEAKAVEIVYSPRVAAVRRRGARRS